MIYQSSLQLRNEYCLENCKVSVVPTALFSPGGEPCPSIDKVMLQHHIKELGIIQQQILKI